jgi:hypothetical protein
MMESWAASSSCSTRMASSCASRSICRNTTDQAQNQRVVQSPSGSPLHRVSGALPRSPAPSPHGGLEAPPPAIVHHGQVSSTTRRSWTSGIALQRHLLARAVEEVADDDLEVLLGGGRQVLGQMPVTAKPFSQNIASQDLSGRAASDRRVRAYLLIRG